MISSKPPNILFPNLVLWCIIMNRSVRQKDCFAIFKVKFTLRAQMIKIWQFLSYLLNCWSFCYWTWFDSTLSYARVFYGDIGLLCSRSKSQQHFKMSMNVCPDNIFWIAEPFTTKLGMVIHHYEQNCLSKNWFAVFKVKVTVMDNIIKIWLFNTLSELLILLQLNLLVGTSLCCEKIGLLCCHPGQGQRRVS